MTALAQGMSGLALVMGFALLCIQQIRAATILLSVQCAAAAVSALALHQPVLALPPLLLTALAWFVAGRTAGQEPWTAPIGGAKLGLLAGAALAILCQAEGGLALPLAVVLLSVLLRATRRHALMHVTALVGIQNGVILAASLAGIHVTTFVPTAAMLLPVPLAASLVFPAIIQRQARAASWFGWTDVVLSAVVFAATLTIPLDSLASIFAPLIGLDGVLRATQRRHRVAMSASARLLAVLTNICLIAAVSVPAPVAAWLAILAAIATSQLPTLTHRWDAAVQAFLGGGLALFGLLLLISAPFVLGYFSLFIGFVMIAAAIPDLAVVLVIIILRLANQAPWPAAVEALGTAMALIGLLACAAMLLRGSCRRSPMTLLLLGQSSIAALSDLAWTG